MKWISPVKYFQDTNNLIALAFLICIIGIGATIGWVQKGKQAEVKEVVKYLEKVVEIAKPSIPTSELIMFLNPKVDPAIAGIIGIEVNTASKKYNLPRYLIISIMRRESNLNPLAASKVAIGLMQIYPKWHPDKVAEYTRDQLYHIPVNVDIGCQIWAEYFKQEKGDLDKTFHAYLSKNASQSMKNGYKTDILTYIARLNIYEFQRLNDGTR